MSYPKPQVKPERKLLKKIKESKYLSVELLKYFIGEVKR